MFFLFNTTKGKKPSEYLSLWSYIAWQAMMVTAGWKNLARQTALPLTSSMYDLVVDGQLLVPQLLCIFQFLHQQNGTSEERFKIYRQSVCPFCLPTLSSYISLGKWLNHFQDFSCSAVAMICRHLEAKPVQQKTINKCQLLTAGQKYPHKNSYLEIKFGRGTKILTWCRIPIYVSNERSSYIITTGK